MRVSNSAPGKGEGGNTVPKVSIGLKSRNPCWLATCLYHAGIRIQNFGSVLCFLLAAMQRQGHPWASCCSATTPTPPDYSGVAPTGFGGLMQPFFSWKDGHLNRSMGSEGEKRSALQQLSSVSWKAAVRKLHPRCPKSNLALRRGIPWKFLQRVQTATGKKPLRCTVSSIRPRGSMLQRPSSFSRPTFAGVANQVAPLTEHSIREKREKEKGEK